MKPDTARMIERAPIEVGRYYTFFCEMQQEYLPPDQRLRQFTGQLVCVTKKYIMVDVKSNQMYSVMTKDFMEITVAEEEINDWNRDLGQYFWPDGTYGPDHDPKFLSNERKPA